MNTVTNEFASLVFDDKVMKETLSDDVYAALKKLSTKAKISPSTSQTLSLSP